MNVFIIVEIAADHIAGVQSLPLREKADRAFDLIAKEAGADHHRSPEDLANGEPKGCVRLATSDDDYMVAMFETELPGVHL